MQGWGKLVNVERTCIAEGYFRNGVSHGRCRFVTANSWFEGEMKDGEKHG